MPSGLYAAEFQLQEIFNRVFDSTNNRLNVSGGLALQASVTTEVTTTSTTVVDLTDATGLSIALATPIFFYYNFRQSTGAANTASLGLTVNATAVRTAVAATPANNAAASGFCWWYFGRRDTNYFRSVIGYSNSDDGTGSQPLDLTARSAALPNAAITDLTVVGLVADALTTLGVSYMYIYTLAT